MNDTLPTVDTASSDSSDRTWAAGAHLAALVAAFATSWFAGIAGAIAALVVWLLIRDRSVFAAAHAKESHQLQRSSYCMPSHIALVDLHAGPGSLVALPLWIALAIAWVVLTIVATVKAYDGETIVIR